MLKTVEAVMKPDGAFKLKEPVKVNKPQRVLITLLGEKAEAEKEDEMISDTEKQRQACLKLSGIFDSGSTDVSQNVDKYLYE